MTTFLRPFKAAIALVVALTVSSPVTASTIVLDVGGPANGFTLLGPPNLASAAAAGAAVTFQVNSNLTNAGLSFGLYCFTANGCAGTAYLTNSALGPTGSITGLQAVSNVSGTFGTTTTNTAFSGFDLVAGIYSVALRVTQGRGSWVGSQSPVFTGNGAATHLSASLFPVAQGNYFPTSATTPLTLFTPQYTLTAAPQISPVPLPATGLLLIGALGGVAALRRKRRTH